MRAQKWLKVVLLLTYSPGMLKSIGLRGNVKVSLLRGANISASILASELLYPVNLSLLLLSFRLRFWEVFGLLLWRITNFPESCYQVSHHVEGEFPLELRGSRCQRR